MIQLGILNAAVVDGTAVTPNDGMPDKFKQLLAMADAPIAYRVFDATQGHFPDSVHACDAYLITGSRRGVYDDDPWIADLADFARACYRAQVKLVGVCFGHQLLAHALGGRAQKSEKGWGLGLRRFTITAAKPWLTPPLERCALYFVHQDQVTQLPPGAERLGGDDFCPNAMFAIGDQVLGIQGHPEFAPGFMARLMDRYRQRVNKEVYETAVASLNHGLPDATIVAHWMRNFLQTP